MMTYRTSRQRQALRRKKRNLIVGILLLLLLLVMAIAVIRPFSEHTDTKLSEEQNIPEYSGKAYIEINGNKPFFETEEITTKEFESYSDLDMLGRCGVAYANISKELLPKEERGEIGAVKPSGWCQEKYPGIVIDYRTGQSREGNYDITS